MKTLPAVRARARTLLTAVAALAVLAAACARPPVDTRPDLVLIVVDTLRADHLPAYGYERPTSPAIDALAAQGVVFEDNTAQSSWTLPSMASLFTGRHVFVNAQRLPDRVPSLAERLRDAGYETAAFIGNPAVSALGDYDRGFDAFIGRESTGNVTWTAPDLQAALARWSDANPRTDKPRFLYLHYMDPHFPYEPKDPPPVAGKVVLRDDTLTAWVSAVKAAGAGTPLFDRFDADRQHILREIDRYDHEIAVMDRSLGQVLAGLDSAADAARAAGAPGARERLVIIASDHGEMLWDHEHHANVVAKKFPPEERTLREVFFRDHSYHLHQQLIGTPLIVSGPGFGAGQRIPTPVENVDIMPTLLRAAELPADPSLDGRALQDVVAGVGRPRPVIYSFCNEATSVRVVDGGWKLVFPTATGDSFGMSMQLYQLTRDARERSNRAADPAAREVLKKLIKLREDAAAAFRLYDNEATESDSEAHLEVLRELGYIEGAR